MPLLLSSRFFYLLNWIYRFIMEDNYSQWIVWVSGAVQTILYIDFFYYYIKGYVLMIVHVSFQTHFLDK